MDGRYADFDIERPRGDTITLPFRVRVNGAPLNLDGYTFWFTGKRALADLDNAAVIACTSAGGHFTIADQTTSAGKGLVTVEVPAAMTSGLTVKTRLFCDLQIKDGNGKPRTPTSGMMTINLDTTRAT